MRHIAKLFRQRWFGVLFKQFHCNLTIYIPNLTAQRVQPPDSARLSKPDGQPFFGSSYMF